MQSLHRNGARRFIRYPNVNQVSITRDASLTSAISRGIRKATGGVDRLGTRRRRDDEDNDRTTRSLRHDSEDHFTQRSQDRSFARSRDRPDSTYSSRPQYVDERQSSRNEFSSSYEKRKPYSNDRNERSGFDSSRSTSRTSPRFAENRTSDNGDRRSSRPKEMSTGYKPERFFERAPGPSRPSQPPRSRFELERYETADTRSEARARRDMRKRPVRIEINTEAPQGVPYTTAGSEFVYGTFAVRAALEAKRRRLYRLYKWAGEQDARDEHDNNIAVSAKLQKVPVEFVAGSWDKMLLKMSGQRQHNGYVLEASPVPKLPIIALGSVKEASHDLKVKVAAQSLEDEATNKIFGTILNEAVIPRNEVKSHFPLLLWLDRVTDTGNIGAIIRSAYFFGVDAIIVPEHGTAPFNPVTIKASAGAAEHMPILVVKKEIEFLRASQENGWKFFAAVAPDSASTKKKANETSFVEHEALGKAPGVLMVGNEGEGLRGFLQQAADESVSIAGIKSSASGLDSLNVSVAAALLMSKFLSKPQLVHQQRDRDTNLSPMAPSATSVSEDQTAKIF